jgi:osmoprotectant transport system permease protein
LCADFVLGQFEKSFEFRKRASAGRRRLIFAGAFCLVALLAALPLFVNFKSEIANNAVEPTGQKVRVGSKDFTESVILAEILAQTLEKRGIAVERQFELGGNLAHDALLSNQVDVYPEYTGTAYTAILKHQPVTDPARVYTETKAEYEQKFSLALSPSLGFSNDFAILVRGEEARMLGLKTISDAVPHAKDWQAGFGQDFMSRADGYSGFAKAYNFNFARQPREMDLSLTYRALAARELDIIAGNSTDGLIAKLDLFQLADDKHYFPPYQAVYIARQDKLNVLAEIFAQLANSISTEDMRGLNYEVDGEKKTPKAVAAEWVQKH